MPRKIFFQDASFFSIMMEIINWKRYFLGLDKKNGENEKLNNNFLKSKSSLNY
jgi:hypothetical protein